MPLSMPGGWQEVVGWLLCKQFGAACHISLAKQEKTGKSLMA
jgi:hypothetical protein